MLLKSWRIIAANSSRCFLFFGHRVLHFRATRSRSFSIRLQPLIIGMASRQPFSAIAPLQGKAQPFAVQLS
jgi:hypothetical protein